MYGITRLVLLDIDPYWVFAYWEVAPSDLGRARRRLGGRGRQAETILRVYDVTGSDPTRPKVLYSFDIRLTPEADNWYINLWSPQRALYAELGLRIEQGRFVPLARSNRIETPPAQASPPREEVFATVGRRYRPAARPAGRRPSAAVPAKGGVARRPSTLPPPLTRCERVAHYQATGVSVLVPVMPPGFRPEASIAAQVTLASLTPSQAQPHAGPPAGSTRAVPEGHWHPVRPFVGETVLTIKAVMDLRTLERERPVRS